MDTLVKSCGSTGAGAAMDLPVGVTRLVHYLGSGSTASAFSASSAAGRAGEAVEASCAKGTDSASNGSPSASSGVESGATDDADRAVDGIDIHRNDDDASWEQPYQTTRALATGVAERASTRKNVGRVRLG